MKIVRVEDFKLDSKVMLSELCEFMNIEYDNALEKSSFGGKKFWGANLKYRANKFDNTRHVPMLNLPKKERRIFSLISLRFNRAVGYGGIDLTPLEKTMAFAYLLVPMQWDIKWFKEDFRLKELLKLFYERIKIVFIYYRNLTAHRQYEIMRKSLINCKKGFDQR
jgi:hypothetical protein